MLFFIIYVKLFCSFTKEIKTQSFDDTKKNQIMKNLKKGNQSNNLPEAGQRFILDSAMFEILAVNELNVCLNIYHKDAGGDGHAVSTFPRSEFITLQDFGLNYFGYKTNN